MNVDIFLIHLIYSGQVKNLLTSTLAFNIAQFFPSLNYQLLPIILDKADFDSKVSSFFSNYLIDRKTQYLQNSFTSPFFCVDIGIGQGSVLSLILSALYLSPIFHIFKKRAKNPVSFLSFVDDGLFISQEKSLEKTNSHLFCSYNTIFSLLEQFRLVIEHRKSEVFHFSRSHGLFNPLYWISAISEVLFSNPKIPGNTQISFLIGNYHFDNTSSFIPTKCCQLSNA